MKKFRIATLFLVLSMIVSMAGSFAVAEGDIYTLNEAGFPDRHWAFYTTDQVDAYVEAGWQPYVGVLWFKDNQYQGEPLIEDTAHVQDVYNQGYRLVILYNWVHDGPSLGKHTEQSVSVGYWILDAVQAAKYMTDFETPELYLEAEAVPTKGYYSSWYLDGQSAADPTGEESQKVLELYHFVRVEYDLYDRGYGESVALRNGTIADYTFDEAVAAGGFDDELWPLT